MIMKFRFSCIIIIVAFLAYSCQVPKSYPPEPAIRFLKLYQTDSTDALLNKVKRHELYFEVIDGDGNVGLNSDDTMGKFHPDSIFYHNLFLTLYQKVNGNYLKIDIGDDLNFRTPYKELIGQNKYLKAEVKVVIEIPEQFFNYDTVMYEFYMYDRTFIQSNIEFTPDIPVNFTGIIKDSI